MRTQATIRILNRLIGTCRDSEELCGVCSDAVESAGLRSLLRYRSEEWGRQGDELQALVLMLGGHPAVAPTMYGRCISAWLIFKTSVLGSSDSVALEVWQTTQQRGVEHYEAALNGYLPERIRRTVSLQANRVLDRSEKLHMIRGEYSLHSQRA